MALSSMMRQYLDIKEKHKNEILMFRVGDFYEMFFDDAITVSRELELTLTGKDCGLEERAPMCGVPYHAVDVYVARLIEKGYRVAICDQLTDPAESKGLVERDVTRIVTAGTLTSPDMLTDREPNYLLAVHVKGKDAGIAYCDVSTGEFYAGELKQWETALSDETARIAPKELIARDDESIREICRRQEIAFTPEETPEDTYAGLGRLVKAQFGADQAGRLPKTVLIAAGMLLSYLNETQKTALCHINEIREYRISKFMVLDQGAITNLELVKTARGGTRKGSLLGVIDKTLSAMGARQLKSWTEQPLLDENEIGRRLDSVERLALEPMLLEDLRDAFRGVTDIERLLSRIAISNVNPRDCLSLASTLKSVPGIKSLLLSAAGLLGEAAQNLDPIEDIAQLIQTSISEDAPVQIKDGGIFKKGFNPRLDEYREASLDGKNWIARLEQREREETGIKNLKIAYNRLFGYYIEVTKSFYDLVPMRYVRKQTLANCERFTTQELKELENTILGAQ
ncbi:MAG: DNA mismatch repair protein MutS, partial [Clostridiales bacterium]|nr:DNA mismatch repair protein MutS [Clostridiales bacterium]